MVFILFLLFTFSWCANVSYQKDYAFQFQRQWMLNPLLVREVNASIESDEGFDVLAKQIQRRYAPGRGLLRLQVGTAVSHYMFLGIDDISGNLIRYLLDGKLKHPGHHEYTTSAYATVYLERKLNSIGNPYMENSSYRTDYSYNFEEEWMFLPILLREVRVIANSNAGFDELALKLNNSAGRTHIDSYGRGLLRLQVGTEIVHHRFTNITDITGKLIRYLLYAKVQSTGEHLNTQAIYATAYAEKTEDSMGRYNNKYDNMLAMNTEIIRQAKPHEHIPYVSNPNFMECNQDSYTGVGNIFR